MEVIYERYSDSAATFVRLDPSDPAVYKQLYRAAKAKLKLRLRATIVKSSMEVPLSNGPTGTDQSEAQTVQGANSDQATVSENGNPATHPQVEVASSDNIGSPVLKEPSPTESKPGVPQPAMPQPAVPQPAVSGPSVKPGYNSIRDNLAKGM